MIHHRPQTSDDSYFQRSCLISSDVVGGSMVLRLSLPFNKGNANSAPNAFIRVDSAGSVALIMPRLDVRESIYTSIRMLISDELEVVPNRVEFEYAPKETFVAYGMFHALTAGNSIAVRGSLKLLGELSATARAMLIAAAARRWGVDARSCHASEGEVIHPQSWRKLKYGDLAVDAAYGPIPKEIALKGA
jgi:isoquinoline 1-oxidoreductase subunit beta